ncbi:MAG: hypothetical protein B6244_02310 [Candidatus Cloacimonetes bacterium 4572_55]|nr:MAG: hypothetical protein B6244_02310 [Candidatus Cloacimonetes bacterium 4572_55]
MIRKTALFSLLICFIAAPCAAFSQYSIQGIGEPSPDATARQLGMGVLGIACTAPFSLSQTNPALAADFNATTFSATMFAAQWDMKDQSVRRTRKSALFPHIRLLIPLFLKLKVGVGLTQRTSVDYHAAQIFPYQGDDEAIYRSVTAVGGLYALRLTMAHQPVKYVSLGLYSDLLFGSIEQQWKTEFRNEFYDYKPILDKPTMHFKGADFTFGVHLRPHPYLSIGGVFRAGRDIDTKTKIHVNFQSDPVDTLESDMALPTMYGFGVSIHPQDRLHFVADIQVTEWQGFKISDNPFPGAENSRRIGIGFEWEGDPRADNFLSRMPVRVGYSDEPWHIVDENGKRINGYFWSVGTSFDLFRKLGVLDAAITYGRRGSNNLRAIQEKVLQGTFTVYGFEKWF